MYGAQHFIMLGILRKCWVFAFLFFSLSCWAAEKDFLIAIQNGKLAPEAHLMKVQKGDQIRWAIRSDADGELHIHAYHIDLQIKANQLKKHSFVANTAGRFRVEWHPESERGKGMHHSEPLAVLEVYPK